MNRSRMLQSLLSVETVDPAFVFSVQTDLAGASANNQFTMPTDGTGYDYTIEWGDGTSDSNVTGDITHTYPSVGTYDIRITGSFPNVFFYFKDDRDKVVELKNWGQVIDNYEYGFTRCSNLATVSATDIPNLQNHTSLNRLFELTNISTIPRINEWDISNITNFDAMFRNTIFNQDISNWNTSNVTIMSAIFASTPFNQDISDWNTSNVTTMAYMFFDSPFDQDISSWNVQSITNLTGFLQLGGLSTANYDALLVGWEAQNFQPNVTAHFGNSTYTAGSPAATARQVFIDAGWSITDGGSV